MICNENDDDDDDNENDAILHNNKDIATMAISGSLGESCRKTQSRNKKLILACSHSAFTI